MQPHSGEERHAADIPEGNAQVTSVLPTFSKRSQHTLAAHPVQLLLLPDIKSGHELSPPGSQLSALPEQWGAREEHVLAPQHDACPHHVPGREGLRIVLKVTPSRRAPVQALAICSAVAVRAWLQAADIVKCQHASRRSAEVLHSAYTPGRGPS